MIPMKTNTCVAYSQRRYILMSAFPVTHSTVPRIGRHWVPSSRWESWGPEPCLSERDPSKHGRRIQTQFVQLPSWNQAHFSTSHSLTSKVSFIIIDPTHVPQSRTKRMLQQEQMISTSRRTGQPVLMEGDSGQRLWPGTPWRISDVSISDVSIRWMLHLEVKLYST